MSRSVELPLWLLVLVLLFAAVTFASHFLLPSVRWFFRRRMERVVAQLNERLERPIQPFKLAHRHDMIQRLIYDPKVAEAISEHAQAENVPEAVAFERAKRYAREIVPSFSASVYFGFATKITRWVSQKLYQVHLDETNEAALKAIDGDATIVFVMNHRSNMDYVLVTYLVANRSALSYAVGEWARIWPLSWLIRAMGAFFIRRKSRNPLYRRVMARYVQLATKAGVTQAVFPEGGLSLDGAMGPTKLGLISYIVADFQPDVDPDVVFVPVALNYDRVLEDRVLTQAKKEGTRTFRGSAFSAVWFSIRYIWRRWRGKAVRFGHAGVGYGEPFSLKTFLETHNGDPTKAVGQAVRKRVMGVIPALPVPTLSYALQNFEGSPTRADLVELVEPMLSRASHPSMPTAADVVDQGLASLISRRIVTETPTGILINKDSELLLNYYARSVAHLFDKR